MPTRSSALSPGPRLTFGRYYVGWLTVLSLWLAMKPAITAFAEDNREAPTTMEYQVKAGFLFNFVKYVEWPASTNAASGKFVIGILDDGTVFPVMAAALNGKTNLDRTVEVRRLNLQDDFGRCQMLFVARSQENDLAEILKKVGGAPVLTVGEVPHFAEAGGCINFVAHGENVRFEVNLAATESARLKISAKIAAMATVVRRPEAAK